MLQHGRAGYEKGNQSDYPAGRYQPDFHGPGVRQRQASPTLFRERRGAQAVKPISAAEPLLDVAGLSIYAMPARSSAPSRPSPTLNLNRGNAEEGMVLRRELSEVWG